MLGELHIRPPGPVGLELGVSRLERLSGVDWGDAGGFGSDRWSVLRVGLTRLGAKASFSLSDTVGVHISGGGTLGARNAPPEAVDVGVGIHKYFAPN